MHCSSLSRTAAMRLSPSWCERHTERSYRIAYRFVQSKESAEDVVQDAFLKLWEEPAKWHGRA